MVVDNSTDTKAKANSEEPKEKEEGRGRKPSKKKYKCTKNCTWELLYYKKGEIIETDKTPPEHFVKIE